MSSAESWTIARRQEEAPGETVPDATGDDLAALYDAYAGTLYRYALTIVGSVEAAEDVLQEVFVGLLRRRGRARIEHLREYLLRATRNQAYMHLRKCRSRSRDVTLETWVEVTADFGQPELAADISAALARLPADQREVIALRLTGELTFREAAEVLGIPAATAASRYRLALSKLRTYLTESNDDA